MQSFDNMNTRTVVLTLTEEHAKLVARACEFYARMKMGQFNEVVWNFLDRKLDGDQYCIRRDLAEANLLEARKSIYPELKGVGHSYGIGKFEDADKTFDIYQVVEYALGSNKEPWSYYKLPKCEIKSTNVT